MRFSPFFLAAVMTIVLGSFGRKDAEEFIDWKAGHLLGWNDYLGKPDPNSDAAALTSTYLSIDFQMSGGSFGWKILCRFSKPRSWVRSRTDYILKHEQGHFDIAEIYARKLNRKMLEYKFNKDTYQRDLQKLYDDLTREKGKFQDQYDEETDHSRKKEEQAKWDKKISGLLEEFKAYADYQSVTSSK